MEIKEALDVIKETKEDFKNVLLERLKLPIINYYIFFLLIYNWDIVVMIFFFEGNAELRIKKVKNLYEGYNFLYALNWRIIVPLLYSFISCIIFPFISSFIENKLKKTNENRIDDFFDLEDKKAEREKEVLDKRSGNKTLQNLENEVLSLNANLDTERENSTKLNNQFSTLNIEFTRIQKINIELSTEINKLKNQLINKENEMVEIKNNNKRFKFGSNSKKDNISNSINNVNRYFNNISSARFSPELSNKLNAVYFVNRDINLNGFDNSEINILAGILIDFVSIFRTNNDKLKSIAILKDFLDIGEIYIDKNYPIMELPQIYNQIERMEIFKKDKSNFDRLVITDLGLKLHKYLNVAKNFNIDENLID